MKYVVPTEFFSLKPSKHRNTVSSFNKKLGFVRGNFTGQTKEYNFYIGRITINLGRNNGKNGLNNSIPLPLAFLLTQFLIYKKLFQLL